jgi:hypothetical protein
LGVEAFRLEYRGIVIERHGRQACSGSGKTRAVGVIADCTGAIDEVHGVDAVPATAFREVNDVVKNRQAAEVNILPDLVLGIT